MSRAGEPRLDAPPEGLVTDYAERLTYERDAGFDRAMPDAVLVASSSRSVAELVAWCRGRGEPVIARGAGTGLSGGALASRGGVVVSLERMRALAVDAASRTARAEAGVAIEEIDGAARDVGLFYPPDPSSGRSSVIGGNVGTNAGGPHCFKYGVTADYVRGLEVVLGNGQRLVLGGLTDAPGYDLRGLVVGSEGTLAIVTAVTLDLRRKPPGARTLLAAFDRLSAAGEAVSAIIAQGLTPAAIEAIDRRGMEVIEGYRQVGLPVQSGAALIIEVDGYPQSLERQIRGVSEILAAHGGRVLRVARTEAERGEIWFARKSAAGALARLAPSYYLTDITVRRSRLAPVLERVLEICDRHDLETASFFHAGDGNLHPLIPCDQRDAELMGRVHRAVEEIIELCSSEGGSITGEHGVGIEKVPFMHSMYAAAELAAMWDVKRAFDPEGLLNPGKVLPDAIGSFQAAPAGSRPADLFRPETAEEAASGLALLTAEGGAVTISADGSEPSMPAGTVVLSTSQLAEVRELAAEDLFVSVGSGMRVEELARRVEAAGLSMRLVPPWPEATVGGLLARNLNAPSRMLFGSLRDAVLAVEVALADGRVLHLGRPLVKNVAGYDLHRMFVGSRGALGLLTEVTLKLEPRAETVRTLEIRVDHLEAARAAAMGALELALVAAGVVVVSEPDRAGFVVRHTAAGLEENVAAELEAISRTWGDLGGALGVGELSASDSWAQLTLGSREGVLIRIGVPPARLLDAVASVERMAPREVLVDWLVDWAVSLVWCTLRAANARRASEVLRDLRAEIEDLEGYLVVVEAPRGFRGGLTSQPDPPGVEIMRRLEAAWDPAGILRGGWSSREGA